MNERQFSNVAQDEGTRQAEIPHQMECLHRTLEGCADAAKQLEARLSGVARAEPLPTGVNDPRPQLVSSGPLTTHGASLAEMVKTAAVLSADLTSLLMRLEV